MARKPENWKTFGSILIRLLLIVTFVASITIAPSPSVNAFSPGGTPPITSNCRVSPKQLCGRFIPAKTSTFSNQICSWLSTRRTILRIRALNVRRYLCSVPLHSTYELEFGQMSPRNSTRSDNSEEFFIREVQYDDLPAASAILVDSFYDTFPMFRLFRKLKELDRIQSNFPYDNTRHSMFIACHSGSGQVLGFIDVDGRSTKMRNAPPRPYLSDLAVHLDWRRRGIAKSLIMACEKKAEEMGHPCLYLRVRFNNEAALNMYGSLGYDVQKHEIFGVKDDTLLLKRDLKRPRLPFIQKEGDFVDVEKGVSTESPSSPGKIEENVDAVYARNIK